MKRINSRQRIYYSIILSILFIMVLLSGSVYAEDKDPSEPVTIISPESIALDLQSGASNAKTQITVQNVSSQIVNINFCLVLGSSKTCEKEYTTVGVNGESSIKLTIQPVDSLSATIADKDLSIEKGKIRTYSIEFNLSNPAVNEIPTEWKNGYLIIEVTNIENSIDSSIPLSIGIKQISWITKIFMNIFDKLNANLIISISFIVSFILCILVFIFTMKKEKYESNKYRFIGRTNPILRYRMGLNQWKLEDSLASNFTIGVGVFASLSGILPSESSLLTENSWKIYSVILSIISVLSSFIYNATARKGAQKDENGNQVKEGYIWVWVMTTALLTSFSLLTQIGFLGLAFESIRLNSVNTLSNGLINWIQVIVILLYFFSLIIYLRPEIRDTIKAQNIKEQTYGLSIEPLYLETLDIIKQKISSYLQKNNASGNNFNDYSSALIQPITEENGTLFILQTNLIKYKLLEDKEDNFSNSKDLLVSTLFQLFSSNLKKLLEGIITGKENFDETGIETKKEKIINLLQSFLEDLDRARLLIHQREKINVAVIELYNTLSAPVETRISIYEKTKNNLVFYIEVAIAQLSSSIELDKILDVDQQFFPNVQRILEELKASLGNNENDPFLKRLSTLFFGSGEMVSEFEVGSTTQQKYNARNDLMTAKNPKDLKKRLMALITKIDIAFSEACKITRSYKGGEIEFFPLRKLTSEIRMERSVGIDGLQEKTRIEYPPVKIKPVTML